MFSLPHVILLQPARFRHNQAIHARVIIIVINKVLIKVTLNKVIAGALYIVICG